MAVCELKHVTKSYGTGPARVDAVKDISLSIDSGEFTVFKGPSGSGKTTLLNMVGCLDTPTEGDVIVKDRSVKDLSSRALSRLRASTIGFVFQSFNLMPVLTALENVELALQLAGLKEDTREPAAKLLSEVGLEGFERRRPNQLSGGQQQRVAIARALVKHPALIIADEPTANLDTTNGAQVLDIMQALNETHGITFLFSSHDPRMIERGRRIVSLTDGVVSSDERRDSSGGAG